jgi:class I fructose-bisphosphate aldolase
MSSFAIAEEAKENGLAVVVWSYARGSASGKDLTAIDVITYAAQIAAQLGAHIIKVKLPGSNLALDAARKVYEKNSIPVGTLAERVAHVIESAFAGRRIVIFSGGGAKGSEDVFNEIRAIRDGGGFGSIIGRNSFQRPWDEALQFFDTVMGIYEGTIL